MSLIRVFDGGAGGLLQLNRGVAMRRAWVLGVAVVSAAVLAGCGGSAANQKSSEKLAAVTPAPAAATPQPATGAGGLSSTGTASTIPVLPAGGIGYPGIPSGPLTVVSRRDAGPVTVRLFSGTPIAAQSCDPYTSQCVPDWCQPTSELALELSTDAIAAREIALNIGVGPGTHLSVLDSMTEGASEGAPVQVALVKVADDVDHVQLAIGSGRDVASPVHGLVALALPGAQSAGTVTAYDASGKALQQLEVPAGATQSSPACQAQPIKLPKPGVQPADRAAAVEQVRAAFENAFTHAPPGGDIYHGLATVQDGAQLHTAVDQVRQNFPQAFDTITVTTGDIVFTDPTHAVVQFTPTYEQGAPYGTQNGTAVLADGKWLVTQATYCGLLRFGAATCP
jgi:hypothetical protein